MSVDKATDKLAVETIMLDYANKYGDVELFELIKGWFHAHMGLSLEQWSIKLGGK